jgi:hypothetical protein
MTFRVNCDVTPGDGLEIHRGLSYRDRVVVKGHTGYKHTETVLTPEAARKAGAELMRLADEIEPKAAPAVAVGDKIRVEVDGLAFSDTKRGDILTVARVNGDFLVADGADGNTWGFKVRRIANGELSIVTPGEAPLAVGDKLRVLIGGQGCATTEAGDILTVVGVGSRFFSAKLPSGRTTELYLRRLTDGTVERLDTAKLETEARDLFAEFRTACERLGINLK